MLLPGRRDTGTKAAYEEVLGRAATPDERQKATEERFSQVGYYNVKDLKDSLLKARSTKISSTRATWTTTTTRSLASRIKLLIGKQTGKRTFKFDKNLLPKYGGDLQGTKVSLPNFADLLLELLQKFKSSYKMYVTAVSFFTVQA